MKGVVTIYKDRWVPSRPWCADYVSDTGFKMKGWMHSFGSKASMIKEIVAVCGNEIFIVRGKDK